MSSTPDTSVIEIPSSLPEEMQSEPQDTSEMGPTEHAANLRVVQEELSRLVIEGYNTYEFPHWDIYQDPSLYKDGCIVWKEQTSESGEKTDNEATSSTAEDVEGRAASGQEHSSGDETCTKQSCATDSFTFSIPQYYLGDIAALTEGHD